MVSNTLVKRFTAGFAAWFLIGSVVSGIMPSVLWAQQSGLSDFESPIIEHEVTSGSAIGGVEVFGATVVDNADVERVSLFYRFTGETEFAELTMREVASSSYYSAKVDTANVPATTDAIEYYLQARDTSGNIVLKGFAFQPLIRPFEIASVPTRKPAQPVAVQAESSSRINWWYVALGVVVLGGAAAAIGNDGGGGGTLEQDCDDGCNVNLTFAPPLE